MAHLLHVEMLAVVRELLGKFLKPDSIGLSAKEILKTDVRCRDLHLMDKRLCVGQYCFSMISKAQSEKKVWVSTVYNSLREEYMKAAEFLLKNLRLNNSTITSLSALSPSLMQDDSVCTAFITLGRALPNVVAPEEIGKLDEEVRAYQIDAELVAQAPLYNEVESGVDVGWWSPIVSMKNQEGGE
ncbi:hypothetical protein XENOCAPTIV_012926 [Xenoophorus captivus]|uniref:Uncharacterized protein n=1 Tax=Xenoophorus captivus TaxID=1517983 RepID=A0ABV0RRV2_9TELE